MTTATFRWPITISYIINEVQASLASEMSENDTDKNMDIGNISVIKPMYACEPPCTKRCSEKFNLDRHKLSRACYHNLPFVCDVCKKRFRTEDLVASHVIKGRCVSGQTPPAV